MVTSGTALDPRLNAAFGLIEAQIETTRRVQNLPGISAAVVLGDRTVWARGFGKPDLERDTPATPETVYRVGSVTKVFTATMLMMLRDEGKLCLDDPVEKHIPGFTIKSSYVGSRPITLRQVVSHSSGLPVEPPLDHFRTMTFPSGEVMARSLRDAELHFLPGTSLRYSNAGFAVLGQVVERAAGVPYIDFVMRRILAPLGMRDSGFVPDASVTSRMAKHYRRTLEDGNWAEIFHPDIGGLLPSGDLYSTVTDMNRFISLQFRRDGVAENGVLAGSSIHEMREPVVMAPDWSGGIGIGWHLSRLGNCAYVSKSGATFGTTADVAFIPELELGMALFTNSVSNAPAMSRTALETLAPIVEQIRAKPSNQPPQYDPRWDEHVGTYGWPLMRIAVDVKKDEHGLFAEVRGGVVPETPRLVPLPDGAFRITGSSLDGETARFHRSGSGEVQRLELGPYDFYSSDSSHG